nr:helix-turn-helix domain-containing protein [uncultured Flavobacterium sp.]
MQTLSQAAAYTLQFINQTNRSVFLTGKAGTGKTTLLREIIQTTHKNTVVVAPTGIAALNANGVTIHSMFQLPFGAFIPDYSEPQFLENSKFETKSTLKRHFKMGGLKKAVIRNMELLIIDEVSMLRADLLDAMDFMMQTVRKNSKPFGGAQVLFIGDLLQLPPVVKDEEWRVLRNYYRGKFFFHSHVLVQDPPLYIELSHIYRQTDDRFISVLNHLRNNEITKEDIEILNQYVQPNFDLKTNEGYICLTTHNVKADAINTESIKELTGKLYRFYPEITGDFPEKIYPLESQLELKVGAQIMFVKNDLSFDKQYFNGKMGTIASLTDKEIRVHFAEENKTIEVEKYEWQNIRYKVDPLTKEIEEEVLGTYVQYPIKLAWAITVHKSQGLTFDKAALDVSQVFLPGQAYVALSRLRSLNGLILLSPLRMNGISNDQEVMDYAQNKASETYLQSALHFETKNFILDYLCTTFDWKDLAQEWRNHFFSYGEVSEASIKSKHAQWAKLQAQTMEQLLDPASKFVLHLKKLFATETVDLNYVLERINAAFAYFWKPMDALVEELLWKLEETQHSKKAKGFFEELSQLEELQTKAVLKLMKAQLLVTTVVAGEPISKEKLTSPEIKNYISNKIEKVKAAFNEENTSLLEEETQIVRYSISKKGPKEKKKTTVEQTYELWLQKKSITEIALMRMITKETVMLHLTKLIAEQKIQINTVLSEEKIAALTEAFFGYQEESLAPLKEKHGDSFTWEELRMFKASWNS